MDSSFKRYVIAELSKMPFYQASSNGIGHTIKCPYCNDDSPSHGHFCLKIDVDNDDEPILYNCLKCPAGGVLTTDVLNDLGISVNGSIASSIAKLNRRYAKKNKLTDTMMETYTIAPVLDTNLAYEKLDYVNTRLGTSIDIQDLSKYKLVTSLSEFLTYNEIDYASTNISPNKIRNIDANYVGFLSLNRNHIIFRKIHDNAYGHRYEKVVLRPSNIDPNSYYMIPGGFDILYNTDMHLHIAEGTFDILSIYTNLYNSNPEPNNLFYSVCGYGYSGVIKNLIRLGINTDLMLEIYADNDKADNEILRMIKSNPTIRPWIKGITIHRNAYPDMKDFGVPLSNIKESKKKYIV